ncbi:hypothetical protein AN958_10481 [Leucoagaricus sp. SymC.cos]|nr:hypothetical protein AN958_10481 [Leucoagaricus sp. SymC.cos]
MSHPTFWPSRTFFYPIGNTPPICLTDHLPPEEDATILLLGCGDPRSILYTIAVDHGIPRRAMDITSCDWEPAIIARNILLLTLIADNVDTDRLLCLWSIFYDLFLDKKSASLLKEQCSRLIEFAADMITWDTSPYGNFVKFTTMETLVEARRHWRSYHETLDLPNSKQKQLREMYLSGMKEQFAPGADLSAVPSAAPLTVDFVSLNLKTYTKYWKTGITNPTNTSTTALQVNPTFLFSLAGRRFHLHYGTDPCSAFHLSLALTKATFEDGSSSTLGKTEREMWDACRDQFSRWTVAFHRRLLVKSKENSTIVIRFGIGDALAYCDGLQLCKSGDFTPSVYSSLWGGAKFTFHDRTMPTSFNVVDTSNLSDHLGLLNILIAVVPLLQKGPHTSLNTTSLLAYKSHPTQRSAIEERALLDFPSIALLLGVTPICFYSGLTFRNGTDVAHVSALAVGAQTRYYERVVWRFSRYAHAEWEGSFTESRRVVIFEPDGLADKLFALYLKMFQDENFGSLFARIDKGDVSRVAIQNTHYHRRSFVRFLRLIRDLGFIESIWPQVLSRLIDRITANTQLLVGANNFQNLFAELHMWGIHSESTLQPDFISKVFEKKRTPFENWETIPPVVCIVLKVPRAALKVLEDSPEDEMKNPIIACETFQQFHNTHDSIRPIFGDIIVRDGQMFIQEDPDGLKGSSALIVSFYLPSWILSIRPDDIRVGLCLKSTPSSSKFASKLGLGLKIYSTPLLNRSHVFILAERPDNPGELDRMARMSIAFQDRHGDPDTIKASVRDGGGEFLSRRLDIADPAAKEALANKAAVVVKPIAPSCVEVVIGGSHRYPLYFPVPVDESGSKTRIARKSSYIEIDLPPRGSPLSRSTLQPFPITLAHSAPNVSKVLQVCWNTPYVNLDSLPALKLSGNQKWMDIHIGCSLSTQERNLQRSASGAPETWGPFLNFKVSINSILIGHAKSKHKICMLRDKGRPHPHLILLFSSIRLDTSSATILGDAAVIFPSQLNTKLLARLLNGVKTFANIYGEELHYWNHALPVFAERCRQWEHLPTCDYLLNKRIPLTIEYGKTPLCSCGKGKNLGSLFEDGQWEDLAPHAIRIALSPIFPVTYLEDVTEPALKGFLDSKNPTRSSSSLNPTASRGLGSEVDNLCKRCRGAGKPKLLTCSGCQLVKYCSKDCQTADWKQHKLVCKRKDKSTT